VTRALLIATLVVAGIAACKRHDPPERSFVTTSDESRDQAQRLRAGPGSPDSIRLVRSLPERNPLAGDRHAIQEGRRLYRWMNCIGCHAEGGGSIGPPLWDDEWRYGARGQDIAESILHGRPDGMPAYEGHLPEDQLWKIVAYVQSMAPRGGYYNHGVR
jgi:cytochrome c oxidase cbb3-type subunit III